MKIALLHLDLCSGSWEKSFKTMERAIKKAGESGAQWVVTPEVALQGYFFYDQSKKNQIRVQPDEYASRLTALAAEYEMTLFLSCAEQDIENGKYYNSCLVFNQEGQLVGRHRKMHTHGVGAEAWMVTGESAEPIQCNGILAGVLICADVWYTEHSEALKKKGADIILAPAAWPPGPCGPRDSWERSSLASGVPVCICNQTGHHPVIDLRKAESAVLLNGEKIHVYSGSEPAILIFDWDFERKRLLSKAFEVLTWE